MIAVAVMIEMVEFAALESQDFLDFQEEMLLEEVKVRRRVRKKRRRRRRNRQAQVGAEQGTESNYCQELFHTNSPSTQAAPGIRLQISQEQRHDVGVAMLL